MTGWKPMRLPLETAHLTNRAIEHPLWRYQVARSYRTAGRSFHASREGHNLSRRHSRTRSPSGPLQPSGRSHRCCTTCAQQLQPDGKFFHLRRRQLLDRGFNFGESSHREKSSLRGEKASINLTITRR